MARCRRPQLNPRHPAPCKAPGLLDWGLLRVNPPATILLEETSKPMLSDLTRNRAHASAARALLCSRITRACFHVVLRTFERRDVGRNRARSTGHEEREERTAARFHEADRVLRLRFRKPVRVSFLR